MWAMTTASSPFRFTPKLVDSRSLRPARPAVNRVHQWHQQIELAFSPLSAPPVNSRHQAWLDHGRDIRDCQRAISDQVRTDLLEQGLPPIEAASQITQQADQTVSAFLELAQEDIEANLGPAPGEFSILAMGKFGGREMTLGSDLDLIFVCEPFDNTASVEATHYFSKLGQKLISLMGWTPDWPASFEIDTRLRAHGGDGELVTPLSGFSHYVMQECWTWELQALTRLRPIAGSDRLARHVMSSARKAIQCRINPLSIFTEVADMRRLMQDERPARSHWDVKLTRGGLIDIEFLTQALQLKACAQGKIQPEANTFKALLDLERKKLLDRFHAASLQAAWSLFSAVRQLQGALGETKLGEADLAPHVILSATGATSAKALEQLLVQTYAEVRPVFANLLETDESTVPLRRACN